jgi:hypothetical protein
MIIFNPALPKSKINSKILKVLILVYGVDMACYKFLHEKFDWGPKYFRAVRFRDTVINWLNKHDIWDWKNKETMSLIYDNLENYEMVLKICEKFLID